MILAGNDDNARALPAIDPDVQRHIEAEVARQMGKSRFVDTFGGQVVLAITTAIMTALVTKWVLGKRA